MDFRDAKQVLWDVVNGHVARINAAAIVAEMADDLITVGGSLTWLKNFGSCPMLK